MSHTPGPWMVAYIDRHGQAVVKAGHIEIATCWNHSVDGIEKEMHNNARLIAAAPDLLEACKTFAEWLRREDEGYVAAGKTRDTPEGEAGWKEWFYGNIDLCSLAQNQARAAIVKAKEANDERE